MTGGGAADAGARHAPGGDERWAEDAAAYAIGALDAGDEAAYEGHLAGCAACAAEVRAYRALVPLLAVGAGGRAAAPSPVLRARIVAAARADGREADGPAAVGGAAAGYALPIRPRTATASMRAVAPARRSAAWGPWLAAAASVALAMGLGAGWTRERQVRLAERQRAVAGLRQLAAEVVRRTALIDASRDSLLATVTAPDVRVARLAVAGAPAALRLLWNPGRGVVLLTATAMPQPRPGRTYQLWGIPVGGKPQSLGVFAPGEDGRVQALLRVPPEATMRVAAVTEEPDGGSPQPTERPLMTGAIGGE